jgi:hypothetical protein
MLLFFVLTSGLIVLNVIIWSRSLNAGSREQGVRGT